MGAKPLVLLGFIDFPNIFLGFLPISGMLY